MAGNPRAGELPADLGDRAAWRWQLVGWLALPFAVTTTYLLNQPESQWFVDERMGFRARLILDNVIGGGFVVCAIIYLGTHFGTAVWLYRLSQTQRALRWARSRPGALALALSFLVPGVNCFLPYLGIRRLWLANLPAHQALPRYFGYWVASSLGAVALFYGSFHPGISTRLYQDQVIFFLFGVFMLCLGLSAFLTSKVIRDLTDTIRGAQVVETFT